MLRNVLLTLLVVASVPMATAQAPTLDPADSFTKYRADLIEFQPEFTVEGARMITVQQAKAKIVKRDKVSVCEGEGTISSPSCATTARGESFSSGGFDWYLWQEGVTGYSRFAQAKTILAKFPSGATGTQHSYALFTYQGYWSTLYRHTSFFALMVTTDFGSPDQQGRMMFFDPNIDYPLFFTNYSRGRYRNTSVYTNADASEVVIVLRTSSPPSDEAARRLLRTGELLGAIDPQTDWAKSGYTLVTAVGDNAVVP